ncbi:hypothetical protein BGW41_003846 [Actinomortierella wolfii]|nr:hypothetical protein BGW41_003846 [Actinomortierella wolfii]
MALPPQYAGHRISGTAASPHTLELYLDYVCPFSAKIWNQVFNHVLPWVEKEYPGRLQVIVRNQIQPWHPTSTIVAEAALAVEKTDGRHFAAASNILFTHQKRYQSRFFDEAVAEQSRNQQYKALAQLLVSELSKNKSDAATLQEAQLLSLLEIKSTSAQDATNHGNQITNDLKYFIKLGRQTGIHVSPTVVWDGVVENSISSGWTLEQWQEFLAARL